MKTKYFMFAGMMLFLLSSTCLVRAATIEFNDVNFFDSTSGTKVIFSADGSSVEIYESGDATTFISNDPFLGFEPELITVGADPFFIEFEYQFIEGAENIDDFSAFVYHSNGNYDQLRWEFTGESTPSSGSGISGDGYKSVIWDMSGLGLALGDILGIDFVLGTGDQTNDPDQYLDSYVTIRNLQSRLQ